MQDQPCTELNKTFTEWVVYLKCPRAQLRSLQRLVKIVVSIYRSKLPFGKRLVSIADLSFSAGETLSVHPNGLCCSPGTELMGTLIESQCLGRRSKVEMVPPGVLGLSVRRLPSVFYKVPRP
jgi:hypothetical protein